MRICATLAGANPLARARCEAHIVASGRQRRTIGHRHAVSTSSEVFVRGGMAPGATLVDVDRADMTDSDHRVPSLTQDRPFKGP